MEKLSEIATKLRELGNDDLGLISVPELTLRLYKFDPEAFDGSVVTHMLNDSKLVKDGLVGYSDFINWLNGEDSGVANDMSSDETLKRCVAKAVEAAAEGEEQADDSTWQAEIGSARWASDS